MNARTRIFRHKKWKWLTVAILLTMILWLIIICLPPSQRTLNRAAAIIKTIHRYELKAEGRTLITLAQDSTYNAACWVNKIALIPSCGGRLIAAVDSSKDSLSHLTTTQIRELIKREQVKTDSFIINKMMESAEAKYFLRVHSVQDEGYDMIAKFAQRLDRDLDSLKRISELLKQAYSLKHIDIAKSTTFTAIYRLPSGKESKINCSIVKQNGQRIIFRSSDHTMPDGAKAISILPWTTRIPDYIFLALYGENGWKSLKHTILTPHLAIRNECVTDTADGQGTLLNGKRCYKGALKAGKPDGYGILKIADSIIYRGQWVAGKRQGVGRMTDNKGRHIRGEFTADTLYFATRRDANGVYKGQVNHLGIAIGHGTYRGVDGSFYEGKWKNDDRNGFGFSISPRKHLRLGEWKKDRYLGERLVYTSERIYGIDISRHQHDVGRRHYPIHWDRLRITHLGTISKKRIEGSVSYPVSFLYIKSTEGKSIRNRYFSSDYVQAKRHGIHVGAYHFFTTTTPAVAQAHAFIKHSRFNKGDLPPVLDLEPFPSQIRKMGGTSVMWDRVRSWLRIVQQHTGVKPILYISQTFVNKYLPEAPDIMKNYTVWIARYGEYKPNVKLNYWQLSPDGRVEGIKTVVDINVFNGYQNVFNDFLKNSTIP